MLFRSRMHDHRLVLGGVAAARHFYQARQDSRVIFVHRCRVGGGAGAMKEMDRGARGKTGERAVSGIVRRGRESRGVQGKREPTHEIGGDDMRSWGGEGRLFRVASVQEGERRANEGRSIRFHARSIRPGARW